MVRTDVPNNNINEEDINSAKIKRGQTIVRVKPRNEARVSLINNLKIHHRFKVSLINDEFGNEGINAQVSLINN